MRKPCALTAKPLPPVGIGIGSVKACFRHAVERLPVGATLGVVQALALAPDAHAFLERGVRLHGVDHAGPAAAEPAAILPAHALQHLCAHIRLLVVQRHGRGLREGGGALVGQVQPTLLLRGRRHLHVGVRVRRGGGGGLLQRVGERLDAFGVQLEGLVSLVELGEVQPLAGVFCRRKGDALVEQLPGHIYPWPGLVCAF
mmetsp:Transcript_21224/g.33520  ORF Transcript_21224/g.33520 Transcript_21224/m.33520 type:complete len:200 (-) Transcript_21224:298-897(-)